MAVSERDVRSSQFRTNGRNDPRMNENEVPLGDLLRRFGQDAAALVKQEIALAKVEVREGVKGYMKDVTRLGMAAAAGLLGIFALTAFFIIGLGDLIDNYWLGALIVAIVYLAIAGMLAKSAITQMKRNSLAPEETVQTLKEDQRWAKSEAQEFKRKLKA
ncbi:MAG TPA: phage holin family protein [Longimicrobiales bacterium]|nr:phage holin family protein [Longimicrobiales bacterium]